MAGLKRVYKSKKGTIWEGYMGKTYYILEDAEGNTIKTTRLIVNLSHAKEILEGKSNG